MRRLALALALLCAAPVAAQEPSLRERFEAGVAQLRGGEAARAVETLGAVFTALQQQRRGPDSGVVAHWLARAMEESGDARADAAHAYAMEALAGTPDSREFVESAKALMTRDPAGRGGPAAEKLVARILRGMSEEPREIALAALVRHYKARGDAEAETEAMDRLATVEGGGELLTLLRGARRALAADKAHREGRYVEARKLADQSLADLRHAGRTDVLGLATLTRARVDFADGAYAGALPFAEEAETLLRAGERALWIEALSMRARLLERLDRADDAVSAYAEADARIAAAGPDDGVLATLRLDRVQPLLRAERVEEARALLEAEKARVEHLDMPKERAAIYVGAFHDRVAALLIAEKDFSGAREAAETALARLEPLPAIVDGLRMEARRRLATALAESDDAEASESALRAAIAMSERLFAPTHPEVAYDLNAYALHLKTQDRVGEAEAALRRVAEILARAHGETSLKHGYALANLAGAIARAGRFEDSDATMARAIGIAFAAQAPATKRIELLAVRGDVLRMAGKPREALKLFDQAIAIAATLQGVSFSTKLTLQGAAAAALLDIGETKEAERLMGFLLDGPPPLTHEDEGMLNVVRLHASVAAARRDDAEAALALARQAGESGRRIGSRESGFVEAWATLLARHAWSAAQADARREAKPVP